MTLRDLILKVHRENEPVRILDIAAGAGRYVIETIRDMPEDSDRRHALRL